MFKFIKNLINFKPKIPNYLEFGKIPKDAKKINTLDGRDTYSYMGYLYKYKLVPESIGYPYDRPNLNGKFFGQGDGVNVFLREDLLKEMEIDYK